MTTYPDDPIAPVPPVPYDPHAAPPKTGLTKREHFACVILAGLLAHPDFINVGCDSSAARACQRADALIVALNKDKDW